MRYAVLNQTPMTPSGTDSQELPELEVKRWYDRRYAETGADTMRPPEAYFVYLEALDVQKGAHLLDVACGPGHLLNAGQAFGLQTSGVDLSEEAVRVAHEVSPQSDVRTGSSDHLEFQTESFDYVTCLGALEHFPDMNQSLEEMQRVAKPNARFCIVVPNINFLIWKLFEPGTEQQEIVENPMSLDAWEQLFIQNGFQILRREKEHWYLKRARFLTATRWLRSIERAALWILWRLLPLRLTYQFQFILTKSGNLKT